MPRATAPSIPLAQALGDAAHLLTGSPREYDPLLERIGDAPYVLLGEASSGATRPRTSPTSSPGQPASGCCRTTRGSTAP